MKQSIPVVASLLWSFLLQYPLPIEAACPNNCNGRGLCDKYGRCSCSKGYQGADCSERICPYGSAWSDEAIGVDNAHHLAECSNRGLCNRQSGQCRCMEGFTGTACERLKCENDCNNFGVCMTLEKIAEDTRDELSQSFVYDKIWDNQKIMACVCDVGHTGYDCSQWLCPNGDDPLTENQVNEVQLLKCIATTGSFALFYRGYPSKTIPYNADAKQLQEALEEIPLITSVRVTFSQPSMQLCNVDANIVQIEFLEQFGSLSPLVPRIDSAMEMSGGMVYISGDGETCFNDVDNVIYKSTKGTKEADPCAGRGICSTDEGMCYCFDTNGDEYFSSDGYGGPGNRGDCGFFKTETVSSCPGYLQCSGHGICDTDTGTYRCSCSKGWTGGDCSERECPTGLSWSSYPTEDNVGHNKYTVCSDMGLCDKSTGTCKCQPAFYGQACEYMACGGGLDDPCSGHGRCMSMNELAEWAEDNGDATEFTYGSDPNNPDTWDGHRVFGCRCDVGYTGYDCSLRECPRGDDPGTYDDHVEVQLLQCIADDGTFQLGFRQQVTEDIPYDATGPMIENALMKLTTLSDLSVSIYDSHTACSVTGNTTIQVSFASTHGDLPPLKVFTDKLIDDTNSNGNPGTGVINIATDGQSFGYHVSIKGTTENAYCNNRGICDFTTGTCHCFQNWASSDGHGGVGKRGDCGYRNQVNTNGGKIPPNHAVDYQLSIK